MHNIQFHTVLLSPQIQVYFNTCCYQVHDQYDLLPLLLVSVNPIIDPWVFIILSPPVPRLLWDKMCKTAKCKSTQEKVRSIHPVLYHSKPPGNSEGGSVMQGYTGTPGTAGSWSLKPLFVCGKDCGVNAHSYNKNNRDWRSMSLDNWTDGSKTRGGKQWVVLNL